MREPEVEDIEQRLAALLFKSLSGNASPLEAVVQAEQECVAIFSNTRESGRFKPDRVILEALIKMCGLSPMLQPRFFSCIVLLCSSSPAGWLLSAESFLYNDHPKISETVRNSLVCSNPTWESLPKTTQQQISEQLIEFSLPDAFRKIEEFPKRLHITPLSIALQGLIKGSGEENGSNAEDVDVDCSRRNALEALVKIVPENCWQTLGTRVCISLFKFAVDVQFDTEKLPETVKALEKREKASVTFNGTDKNGYTGAPSGEMQNKHQDSEASMLGSSPSEIDDIYTWVKRTAKENKYEVKARCQEWLKDDKYHYLAVAYIAAPKCVNEYLSRVPNLQQQLDNVPEKYRSYVDDDIDDALAKAMMAIPECRPIFHPMRNNGTDVSLKLKKIALLHPHLFIRRRDSMFAVAETIIRGLSEEGKYHRASLWALEAIVVAFADLQKDSARFAREIGTKVLKFVIDDGRGKNGMPGFIISLTMSVLKLFSRHGIGENGKEVRMIIEDIRRTNTGSLVIGDLTAEILL